MSEIERDGEIIKDPQRQREARILDLEAHKAGWMGDLVSEQVLANGDQELIERATTEIEHIDSTLDRLVSK